MTDPTDPTDPIDGDDSDDADDADDTDGGPLGGLADLLGGGALPDIGSLMGGLAAVQSVQDEAFEGSAGGGLVRIRANGRMDVESVSVSPDAVADGDAELVADLVLAALRDLTAQIAGAQQQAMGPLGGILGQ